MINILWIIKLGIVQLIKCKLSRLRKVILYAIM